MGVASLKRLLFTLVGAGKEISEESTTPLAPRDASLLSMAPKVTSSVSGYQNAFTPAKDTFLAEFQL